MRPSQEGRLGLCDSEPVIWSQVIPAACDLSLFLHKRKLSKQFHLALAQRSLRSSQTQGSLEANGEGSRWSLARAPGSGLRK